MELLKNHSDEHDDFEVKFQSLFYWKSFCN